MEKDWADHLHAERARMDKLVRRVAALEQSRVTMETLAAIVNPLCDRIEELEAQLDATRGKGLRVSTTDTARVM